MKKLLSFTIIILQNCIASAQKIEAECCNSQKYQLPAIKRHNFKELVQGCTHEDKLNENRKPGCSKQITEKQQS